MSHIYFNDKGEDVLIQAQLPNVHEIMSRISTGVRGSTNARWEHLEYFDLSVYPMDDNYHMGRIGTLSFLDSGRINLSFLRATDLDEGIEIALAGGDYPAPDWEFFRRNVAHAIRDFVKRHHVPRVSYSVKEDGREVDSGTESIPDIDYTVEMTSAQQHKLSLSVGADESNFSDQIRGFDSSGTDPYYTYQAA